MATKYIQSKNTTIKIAQVVYKRLVVIIVVGIADLYMAKKREQMLVIHKIQSVTEDIEMKQGETTVKEASSRLD